MSNLCSIDMNIETTNHLSAEANTIFLFKNGLKPNPIEQKKLITKKHKNQYLHNSLQFIPYFYGRG